MSVAAERKAMRDVLPEYALLPIRELAAFLGASEDIARRMVDAGTIPSVRVGKRRLVDPMDAVAYVLAEREGMTAAQWWAITGDAAIEQIRRHVQRIKRLVA